MPTVNDLTISPSELDELKRLIEFFDNGGNITEYVEGRITSHIELLQVYKNLNSQGLVEGILAWDMFICHDVTIAGRDFLIEFQSQNATEIAVNARIRRDRWIDRASGLIIGIIGTVAAGLILKFVFGI
jgi:hypothetical protein